MYFTDLNHDGGGTKFTKFAVVAGLHALVAVGFIKAIENKSISMPKVAEDLIVMIQPEIKEPPPPPEPPKPMPKVAPPEVVVPPVEVEVPPPEMESPVQAVVQADPAPAEPAAVQSDAPPAQPSSNTGTMRSAVLADANGCAKPEYPANAVRNGDTGTVTLALLIGPDGKVQSSRIQSSSGSRDLDRAAVKALSLCTFQPAMNNGVPEAGWGQIAYVWTLE